MGKGQIQDNYHGYAIYGERDFPAGGDYERWHFTVEQAGEVQFHYSVKVSGTQAVIIGGDDAAISAMLRDTGLRRIHGKIDFGQYEVGKRYEDVVAAKREQPSGTESPQKVTGLSDREIRVLILQVLEKIRREYPLRYKYDSFDVAAYCEVLDIPVSLFLANAGLLREEGCVADSLIQQLTIENGGLYITAKGVQFLEALRENIATGPTPPRVYVDDIDSFAEVRRVKSMDVAQFLSPKGCLNALEEDVQIALEAILHEPLHKKDWGGETNDLYTSNLTLQGVRIAAAFLLKGKGLNKPVMEIADCGANGDQLIRLVKSPADLFVVQYVGNISESIISDMEDKVQAKRSRGSNAWFCIINGQDTARLLYAYGKLK